MHQVTDVDNTHSYSYSFARSISRRQAKTKTELFVYTLLYTFPKSRASNSMLLSSARSNALKNYLPPFYNFQTHLSLSLSLWAIHNSRQVTLGRETHNYLKRYTEHIGGRTKHLLQLFSFNLYFLSFSIPSLLSRSIYLSISLSTVPL